MIKEKMYISGKMKGLDNFRSLFAEVEEEFKNQYEIVNPCHIHHKSPKWEDRILYDLNVIMDCDTIYMLNNWKDSNGAQVEHYFAQGMGKKIIYQK